MKARTSPAQLIVSLLVVLFALLAVAVVTPPGPVLEFVRSVMTIVVLVLAALMAIRFTMRRRAARAEHGRRDEGVRPNAAPPSPPEKRAEATTLKPSP